MLRRIDLSFPSKVFTRSAGFFPIRENKNSNPGRVKNTCEDGGHPDRCFRNLSAVSEEVIGAKASSDAETWQAQRFAPLPAVLLAGVLTSST